MSDSRETLSLDLIGTLLRAIQAEQRTMRGELTLLRDGQARLAARNELADVLRVISERIGNFEALIEARMDQLNHRFDALSAQLAAK